jgi:hypothetical protein
MKKGWIVFIGIVVVVVLVLGWFGFIPGLSTLMGANKPVDLGLKYTEADFNKAHGQSGVNYETVSGNPDAGMSISFAGSHEVNTSWTSAEMTSLLNNRPWKYWPIKNVQLRINPDNTVEMSGVFNEKKLEGYAAGIGTPQAVIDRLSILPAEAAFYLKGSAALSNNQVSKFDITSAKLNRIPIPTSILLSLNNEIANYAYAADGVTDELSKYSGKKQAIVNFINEKLAWVSGFYAKSAQFKDGKLEFDGSLSDKIISAQ